MALPRVPVISLKGKPFDRGRQYGTQARERISRNVDAYFEMWITLCGSERNDILQKCAGLIPVIGEYDAEILEELEGIARGADLPIEEVVALNARYDITSTQGIPHQYRGSGCTSMAALPQVTQNGHTILGQNWDWRPRFQELNVILEVEQDGKPNIVTQTEAGTLAHRGMNSAGLGVCFNALSSSQDKFEFTVPFLIMMRGVLNATSFSKAMKAVLNTRSTLSGNYLIAHRDGEVINLEVAPTDVGIVYADDGVLTHSNHFLSFTNREDWVDILKLLGPDSLFRCHRARRLLESDKGNVDVGSFQRVFKDHFSYPHAICRHVDANDEEPRQSATLFSIVMDLNERAIYVAEGSPCQTEYYQLTSLDLLKD